MSVRQFSCMHGIEPDGWCEQCDPEESARYLALLRELAVHTHGPWQCHECVDLPPAD